jgi:hypothetical protein
MLSQKPISWAKPACFDFASSSVVKCAGSIDTYSALLEMLL